jgi:hypothetical protein
MSRGQITKDIIKYEILKIKSEVDREGNWTSDPKWMTQCYLNRLLDKLEEYRY